MHSSHGQVKAQPQPVEDEDGTDEEQEEAIQELGEFMGAEVGVVSCAVVDIENVDL